MSGRDDVLLRDEHSGAEVIDALSVVIAQPGQPRPGTFWRFNSAGYPRPVDVDPPASAREDRPERMLIHWSRSRVQDKLAPLVALSDVQLPDVYVVLLFIRKSNGRLV